MIVMAFYKEQSDCQEWRTVILKKSLTSCFARCVIACKGFSKMLANAAAVIIADPARSALPERSPACGQV
jgi:hypothetical protein